MLQKLHPDLKTWGELMRHYKRDSPDRKSSSDKNLDEETITIKGGSRIRDKYHEIIAPF